MTLSPPADQYFLSGTFNFRDVGGLRTVDGSTVRHGVLLRSAGLQRLDDAGRAALRELGVAHVHDLRGHPEIEHLGADRLPEGVRQAITPFDLSMGAAPPHQFEPEAAYAHMLEVYRMFPLRQEAHDAIAALADSITRGEGAALVHCAAGKDRTGWAVATVLRAVGVTEDDIVADYLASNGAVPALRTSMTSKLLEGEELSVDLLGVREDYLATATNSMRDRFGDLDGYLDAIGLTAQARDQLRERMIE